jgi:transglutaminase-like putative cysteine protease
VKLGYFSLVGAMAATTWCLNGSADSTPKDETNALATIGSSSGGARITALRRIWSAWDRNNPETIEETLLSAARSPKLDSASRVYAGLLSAYARSRRGDMIAARDQISKLGFVNHWLVVGPFDNEGKSGLIRDFQPEHEFAQELMLGRTYPGKERPVKWRVVPNEFNFGWIDFGALMRPQKNICAYATTFVRVNPDSNTTISAWVGVAGAFQLFVNGENVLHDDHYRGHDVDRFATTVRVAPGYNDFTVKVCSADNAPVLSLRLADAQGNPDRRIETSNDPLLSAVAHSTAKEREKHSKAPVAKIESNSKRSTKPQSAAAQLITQTPSVRGPIQSFDLLVGAKRPAARDLANYAEYLQATKGDDPAQHQARDLATQAAEQQPSVPNYLLASTLAEDRNQRVRWLEKAEALTNIGPRDKLRLVLARAAHERSGPHPQGALPFFKTALAIDPDNVEATVQLADLYGAFGLDQTALVLIDGALKRLPHAVRLLSAKAERLRKLGRSTEASEVERQYANLRFDDGAWLGKMVELSLSRQDAQATQWWSDRLLYANPQSQWALGVAARARRATGSAPQALELFQKALELAPEDVGTLRALADLRGELGQRPEQVRLLRRLLDIAPQNKDVRDYVEHLEPQRARPDEMYAWSAERFLPLRYGPAKGQVRRTLRDLNVTTVFSNGLSSRFRQLVFQPLTDASAAISRQFAFSYEADRQVVQLRGARVYRGDGRIDEAIESGEGAANDPSISMYTSQRTFYVQFPRLEPNDVVELRYRIEDMTPRNEYADYFGDLAYLQQDEPVKNAEYILISPRTRKIRFDTNLSKLLKHQSKDANDTHIDWFTADELEPIHPEPHMPSYGELAGFIHLSTFDSWDSLGRWYWGFIKDQFDVDEETRRLAIRIAGPAKTEAEKVQAVYDWVVQNTRYVALEFGVYGYKPHRAVQTLTRGWGDCKDKATAIIVLLKNLGIEARFVALRTQLRGDLDSSVASLAPFDHAIAFVPSLNWYLDGTAEGSGSRELPVMDRCAMALHIWDGKAQIVRIPFGDPKNDQVRRDIAVQLDAQGAAVLDVHVLVQGNVAPEWRHRYEADATRSERVVADLGREFPGFSLLPGAGAVSAQGLDDIERDVVVDVRGRAPDFARRESDLLSLAVTPEVRFTPLYASLSERVHDVRLLSVPARQDTFSVRLPPGYRVTAAPRDVAIESQFGNFWIRSESAAGKISVKTYVAFTKKRIKPQEYAAFRKFCTEIDRALEPRLQIGR